MNRKLWDKVKFRVNSRPQQQHLNLKELTDKTPGVLPWENRKETMVGQSIHSPFWQDIILSGFTISPYPRWRKARNSTNTYRSFSSTRQFLSKESFLWRWYDKISELSNFKGNLVSGFNKLKDMPVELGSKESFLRKWNSLWNTNGTLNIQFNCPWKLSMVHSHRSA